MPTEAEKSLLRSRSVVRYANGTVSSGQAQDVPCRLVFIGMGHRVDIEKSRCYGPSPCVLAGFHI